MGEFVNGFWNKLVSILLSITVIGINLTFIISRITLAHVTGLWLALIGKDFEDLPNLLDTF